VIQRLRRVLPELAVELLGVVAELRFVHALRIVPSEEVVLASDAFGFPVGAYLCAKTWAVMTLKTNPATVVVERPETAG